eukprot:s2639_g8.t1
MQLEQQTRILVAANCCSGVGRSGPIMSLVAPPEGPMTSTEESTVAPDTPGSSDVSAPSAGQTSGPRRITAGTGASSRLCRALGKDVPRPLMARVFREEKQEPQESVGTRSVPAPRPCPRSVAPILARPAALAAAEVIPRSARALGTRSTPGLGPRARAGPGRTGAAPSPPRQSPARSARSNSPSSPRLRSRKELEQQKVALELQIDEANRSRVALERLLTEERSRGAADRARLAALGARIEQLEQSRGTGPRVVQENRTLHTELEAQSQQIEVLRQQVQLLRDGHMAEPQLKEENLRLRRDLEHSRAMLSRYTDELATIMPGMQKVIHKFQCDLQPGRRSFTEDGEVLDIVEDCVAAEGTSAQMRHHPPPPPECFSERRPCPSAPASASPARRASHPESQASRKINASDTTVPLEQSPPDDDMRATEQSRSGARECKLTFNEHLLTGETVLQSSDEQSGCSDDFCKGQACWQSRCWARQRSKRTDSCRTCLGGRASVWLPLQACRREHGRAATKCRQCRPTADAGFPAHSFSGAAKGGFMLRGGRATTLALLSSDAGSLDLVRRC